MKNEHWDLPTKEMKNSSADQVYTHTKVCP